MAFGSNFDSPLQIRNGTVAVSGSSSPLDPDMELMFRAVALQQEKRVACGKVNPSIKWSGEVDNQVGLEPGEAVALGTETYRVTTDHPEHPAFATFTWAQTVTLK
jgi:hypothetical protein